MGSSVLAPTPVTPLTAPSVPAFDPDALRRLAGAILLQAVRDAKAGHADALAWLGADPWAETLMDHLDLDPGAVRERLGEIVPQTP